jgi:hypothetical protein
MAIWEYLGSTTLNHSFDITTALPTSDRAWGKEYITDYEPPEVQHQFEATGMTWQEKNRVMTAATTRHAVVTLTSSAGDTYTGRVKSVSCKQIPGSSLWTVSLVLRGTANEAAGQPSYTFTL